MKDSLVMVNFHILVFVSVTDIVQKFLLEQALIK